MKRAAGIVIRYRAALKEIIMPDTITALGYVSPSEQILIEPEKLQERIFELGRQLDADYAGKELVMVCILKGGVLFLTDLMRAVHIPHSIDFMAVSSYGVGARESTGVVRIIMDLERDIRDKYVLIVEDIIDSGRTLSYICNVLQARGPASLKICTLLNKYERREIDVALDYVGFDIPNEFVFGYGLDVDEYYRNLPFIGVLRT
jgi:hypoxanthine phosphoribosyltransferase